MTELKCAGCWLGLHGTAAPALGWGCECLSLLLCCSALLPLLLACCY